MAVLPALLLFLPTTVVSPLSLQAQDPDILIHEREAELPDWAKDNFKRRDPGFDQWRTEVLFGSAKPVLEGFLDAMVAGGAETSEFLADDFQHVLGFRPSTMDVLYDQGGIQVQRFAKSSLAEMAPSTPLVAAANMLSFFKDATDLHAFVKIIQVIPTGAKEFTTGSILHLSAHRGASILQQNMEWECNWKVGDSDEQVLLQSIRCVFYEEVTGAGRLFGEITGDILGQVPFFKSEMLRGTGAYQFKTDRLIGNSFIGAQGIAIGDANNDGRDDIYVCQQGGLPNRLYIHKKDGSVMDATKFGAVGFLDNTRSALFVDLDNDNDQDLVLAVGANVLIAWNNGRGVFGNLTPLNGPGTEDVYSISSADADNDGDLDLYAVRYVANGLIGGVPTPYHDADNGASNIFWRNEGNRKFVDATAEVGLDQNNGKFSLASLWDDFDDDGDQDLYVTNDFGKNNLYLNEDGHFRDIALEVGAEDLASGMGITAADIDLDGDLDLYVSNMFSAAGQRIVPQSQKFMAGNHQEVHQHYQRHARGNTLLTREADGTWKDVTDQARVAVGGWAWGARFVDFNNDGLEDIYVPNGFVTNKDPDDL